MRTEITRRRFIKLTAAAILLRRDYSLVRAFVGETPRPMVITHLLPVGSAMQEP